METNYIKIECPEGYEIDLNNSNLKSGYIKFKPLELNYQRVSEKLFSGNPVFWIESNGLIESGKRLCPDLASNSNTYLQLDSLLALNKLCNVAKYLNKNWIPRTQQEKYHIQVHYSQDDLGQRVRKLIVKVHMTIRTSAVYFRTQDDAYQAIKILGEELILKALYLNH